MNAIRFEREKERRRELAGTTNFLPTHQLPILHAANSSTNLVRYCILIDCIQFFLYIQCLNKSFRSCFAVMALEHLPNWIIPF